MTVASLNNTENKKQSGKEKEKNKDFFSNLISDEISMDFRQKMFRPQTSLFTNANNISIETLTSQKIDN